jgi:nitrogen fixation protein FixH
MSTAELNPQAPRKPLAQREATAQMLWTGGIIGFFLIQAMLWTVAITLTSQDPSHAVLEGYDQRALNWDSWQESQRASAALGWSSKLDVSETAQVDGYRSLILQISNRDGSPLTGATATLRVFHRARAGEAKLIPLKEATPGSYIGDLQAQHAGFWTLELIALKGEQRYLEEFRMELDRDRSKVLVYHHTSEPR